MKRATFGLALLFWFVAGMSTEVAVARALYHWRTTEQLTHYDALCAARGGTAVRAGGRIRCVTCDGS